MNEPHLLHVFARGLELAVWDWPGEGPPLLFVHATGFHGRLWDQIIRRFAGRRSLAMELRGHGHSSKPDPPYHWAEFGLDVAAVLDVLRIEGAIGIGHSTGGHALVTAALERPAALSALLLVDPTIFQPEFYGTPFGDSSFIARRRNQWHSPDEMFDRFRDRPPFSVWRPEILRDYCNYGLLPQGLLPQGLLPQNGECVLACPPAIEADIYSHASEPESNLRTLIPRIAQPVTVVRGGIPWIQGTFNLMASPTASALASWFPNGRDVLLADATHYIPMESPELVAEEIHAISAQTGKTGEFARP